jgi:hypothetical protein
MRRITCKGRALLALATLFGATLVAAAMPLAAMAANWGP